MLYIDMAEIHEFDVVGQAFYNAMSGTEMIELFDLESVRTLIMFKWPVVKNHIVAYLLCPFLLFLFLQFMHITYFFEDDVAEKAGVHKHPSGYYWTQVPCLALSFYFLSIECF